MAGAIGVFEAELFDGCTEAGLLITLFMFKMLVTLTRLFDLSPGLTVEPRGSRVSDEFLSALF